VTPAAADHDSDATIIWGISIPIGWIRVSVGIRRIIRVVAIAIAVVGVIPRVIETEAIAPATPTSTITPAAIVSSAAVISTAAVVATSAATVSAAGIAASRKTATAEAAANRGMAAEATTATVRASSTTLCVAHSGGRQTN